jgi:putative Holliday junction resolvase
MIGTDRVAFASALPMGGRLAGLDVGTRTIGIALCDSMWTIASPAETIRRTKFSVDRALLRAIVAKQQVKGLVIGLPILLWDERWSTQAVTRTLLDADASRARRAELVDKMAAGYILQGAIDALASLPHRGE